MVPYSVVILKHRPGRNQFVMPGVLCLLAPGHAVRKLRPKPGKCNSRLGHVPKIFCPSVYELAEDGMLELEVLEHLFGAAQFKERSRHHIGPQ